MPPNGVARCPRVSARLSLPSANQAQPCLASEIRRDWARSWWCGRRLIMALSSVWGDRSHGPHFTRGRRLPPCKWLAEGHPLLGCWNWSWNPGLLTSCWSTIPASGSPGVICSGGLGFCRRQTGGVAETEGQSAGLPTGPLRICGPRTVCCPVLLKSPKSGSLCQMSSLSNVRSIKKTNHSASLLATGALG